MYPGLLDNSKFTTIELVFARIKLQQTDLNAFTRIPLFAHSTAKLAAMCLTAIHTVSDPSGFLPTKIYTYQL
jgi:hypothetical protein